MFQPIKTILKVIQSNYKPAGILFLTSASILPSGSIDFANMKYITPEMQAGLTKAQITSGDVIFPNRGARNGQLSGAEPIAVLVPDSIPVGNVNPQVTRLKLCSDLIDNRFICFMLRTPDFLRQFGSVTSPSPL